MAPITFTCHETLPLAPEEIAEHILDVSKWPSFRGYGPLPGIKSAEFETRTPNTIGSRIRVTNLDESTHTEEIVEWHPDRRVVLQLGSFSRPLSSLATHFVEAWDFERVGSDTKVTRSFELNPRSMRAMPVLWLISFFLKGAIACHLRDIKKPATVGPGSVVLGSVQENELNPESVDAKHFKDMYAGQPPWEIGRPQKVFVDGAERIAGSILDSGCGTGENALFFATRGHTVTGIDFLAGPIERAKQRAAERGLTATFLVMDARAIKELPEAFDSVIDCGLFHVFGDEDRRRYVEGLASVLKPGGRLFLLCFSDAEPEGQGPRRVTRKEIEQAFADGWVIESMKPSRYEVRPDSTHMGFSEGGPKAWFVVARRETVSIP